MEIAAITILIVISFILAVELIGLINIKQTKSGIEEKNEKIKQENIKIKKEIEELNKTKDKLNLDIANHQKKVEELYKKYTNDVFEQIKNYQKNMDEASSNYINELEQKYDEAESKYNQRINKLYIQESEVQNQIKDAESHFEDLKNQINAATEAQLREREKEEKLDFYKLYISPIDLEDIEKLNSIKLMLHNPVILSKLIWSTYFQKQTTEMCNRIFGTKQVCGIYKITNLKTKQCYIGQSVNVQDRMKQHIKYGLGIEASATNKLYNSMQKDGVWNFSFELLEECPREKLNEAEKRWIEIYRSNEIGFNLTKGISKE